MKLSKENIQQFSQRQHKLVSINGYEINIIEMTIPQQLEIENIIKDKQSNNELINPVLKFSVVDDNNEPLLNDENIKNLPAKIAVELFKQCIELNSLSEQDLENRAKNS